MEDDKKSKASSHSKEAGKATAKKSEGSQKRNVSENSSDVTGNVVPLPKAKVKKIEDVLEIQGALGLDKADSQEVKKKSLSVSENQMEKKMSKTSTVANPFEKFSQEAVNFSKDCSEACAKSSQILMRGFEDIFGAVVTLVQTSAEKNAKFVKEAMSSKTMNEFAELQSKMAQAGFDDFMSGATKISEMSVKILTDGSEPVSAQMTKAMQKATEAMAA